MTTDMMEVYSLEEGDTIVYRGNLYRFLYTSGAADGSVRVHCVDEEGQRKCISVPDDFTRVRIVCDEDHTENAY